MHLGFVFQDALRKRTASASYLPLFSFQNANQGGCQQVTDDYGTLSMHEDTLQAEELSLGSSFSLLHGVEGCAEMLCHVLISVQL